MFSHGSVFLFLLRNYYSVHHWVIPYWFAESLLSSCDSWAYLKYIYALSSLIIYIWCILTLTCSAFAIPFWSFINILMLLRVQVLNISNLVVRNFIEWLRSVIYWSSLLKGSSFRNPLVDVLGGFPFFLDSGKRVYFVNYPYVSDYLSCIVIIYPVGCLSWSLLTVQPFKKINS